MNDDWTPILTGTVGSTAYGLATPQSDVDTLGVAVAPTRDVLGLHPPRDKTASFVGTQPDVTIHEIGKYLALALKANPTVTELLWLPDDCYTLTHPAGLDLMELRRSLLGARAVRNAYLGYATSQFKKMAHRGDGKFSSNTRNRVACNCTCDTPSTLADHEDVYDVQSPQAAGGVQQEQPIQGRPGSAMQGVRQGTAAGGLRPQSGAVPQDSESTPQEARRSGLSRGTSQETPQGHLRDHPGGGAPALGEAEGSLPDMRISSEGSGSLSHHEQGARAAVSQVQSGPGALHGQPRDAREGAGVPDGCCHGISEVERQARRRGKHARHLMRLLTQGTHLFVQGEMQVRLENPQEYHDFGELVESDPERGLTLARLKLATCEGIFDEWTSALPDEPDPARAQEFLINVRKYFLINEEG